MKFISKCIGLYFILRQILNEHTKLNVHIFSVTYNKH